jgi:hypothetical protein
VTRLLVLAAFAVAACRFDAGGAAGDAAFDGDHDGPPGDVDGDGIANADDNCPSVANSNQANEDGDDRGDACDLCPHLAGTVPGGDADDDGDGVGNQCDPGGGVDRKVLFLGFNDASELATSRVETGSGVWTISGGKLHQTDPTLLIGDAIAWTTESITGSVAVETNAHVDDLPVGVSARLVAAIGGYTEGAPPDFYSCGLRGADIDQAATVAAYHYIDVMTIGDNVIVTASGKMSVGVQGHLVLHATTAATGSTLDCVLDTTQATVAVPSFTPTGYAGVRTYSATASFDYLFVVAIGS